MYLKRLMILVSLIFIINSLQAQRLEYMQPVGYQSPFLKSGQFISNLYFNSHQSESNYSSYERNMGNYNLNFSGYLGLTDYLTLTTRLGIHPAQKTIWSTGSRTDKMENNLNFNPELILSYRPIEYLEIFGSVDYRKYETTQGPYTYLTERPRYDPNTHEIIYEERMVEIEGMDPYKTTRYIVRFGLTYSGKLW